MINICANDDNVSIEQCAIREVQFQIDAANAAQDRWAAFFAEDEDADVAATKFFAGTRRTPVRHSGYGE